MLSLANKARFVPESQKGEAKPLTFIVKPLTQEEKSSISVEFPTIEDLAGQIAFIRKLITDHLVSVENLEVDGEAVTDAAKIYEIPGFPEKIFLELQQFIMPSPGASGSMNELEEEDLKN